MAAQFVEKVFSLMCFYYILLTFIYRGKLPIVLFIGQPHYFYLHCYLLHLLSSSLFVGEEACVKSNMVYTLCKHMVYMLSLIHI